jgi:hypothetical protein
VHHRFDPQSFRSTTVSVPCLILIHDDTPAQCRPVVTRTINNSPSARAIASARALSFGAFFERKSCAFERIVCGITSECQKPPKALQAQEAC